MLYIKFEKHTEKIDITKTRQSTLLEYFPGTIYKLNILQSFKWENLYGSSIGFMFKNKEWYNRGGYIKNKNVANRIYEQIVDMIINQNIEVTGLKLIQTRISCNYVTKNKLDVSKEIDHQVIKKFIL